MLSASSNLPSQIYAPVQLAGTFSCMPSPGLQYASAVSLNPPIQSHSLHSFPSSSTPRVLHPSTATSFSTGIIWTCYVRSAICQNTACSLTRPSKIFTVSLRPWPYLICLIAWFLLFNEVKQLGKGQINFPLLAAWKHTVRNGSSLWSYPIIPNHNLMSPSPSRSNPIPIRCHLILFICF